MNRLRLNRILYKKETIIKAIDDFNELASINLNINEHYYICEFNSCYYDSHQTINEFENYLIDLSNKDIK